MIERILSDGQPGAASAALRAAHVMGIAATTIAGPRAVEESQATLLFASARIADDRSLGGIRRACASIRRPALVIPVWSRPDKVPRTAHVADLIRRKGFKVLNVAGTRGSADPAIAGVPGSGIESWTFCYLLDVFTLLKGP